MTTFKGAQNQLVHVQIESVEGEYVSLADYMDIQLNHTKDLIKEQERRVAEMAARMKAEQVKMQQEAFVASLAMRWWR